MMYKIGLDIGSTTAKIVVIGETGKKEYVRYERHNARIAEILSAFFSDIRHICNDGTVTISLTGSIGMGVAEKCGLPFIQEVVAAANAVRDTKTAVSTMIDIGGEDAKVVFFNEKGEAADLRMNGNCAGGTGAFIDQMAILLGVDVNELSSLAEKSSHVYPIASRCGVFSKTDIQNLIAKNVPKEDIAASIFHAVTVQTVSTLAHGCDITPPVLFCGGPLTFISSLRNSFVDYLHLKDGDVVLPHHSSLLPAIGAALNGTDIEFTLTSLEKRITEGLATGTKLQKGLQPIFTEGEYQKWKNEIGRNSVPVCETIPSEVYVGIDSGSTTTKVVILDRDGRMVFWRYLPNGGNPVNAAKEALDDFATECEIQGVTPKVAGGCSTGYGEDLIKAAFRLDSGIIETVAHYIAAESLDPEVSFILDIGGQDMKAIYVSDGVINRIEINEACSSGCGSFLETFAGSLGYTAAEFSSLACRSENPCDLGTRCTVFMNSKVKQVLREGYRAEDIAAGLAYSVVRNCLYKVLKLNDVSSLGRHIVVQGGTMRNDAVVRVLEILTGAKVSRSDHPELMGAYGCALYAMKTDSAPVELHDMIANSRYGTGASVCRGCENNCLIQRYRFADGKTYYSGNKCEKIFSNSGEQAVKGCNVFETKLQLLFAEEPSRSGRLRIGIPRVLNMYEDYPFWKVLFTEAGAEPVLSSPSEFRRYEADVKMVMSDNICFPAKVVHSHVTDLCEKGVDRIFMPFVIFNRHSADEQNSYNCPIVADYSEVVRNVQTVPVPFDTPVFSMKDDGLFRKQCLRYLRGILPQTSEDVFGRAFDKASDAYRQHVGNLVKANEDIMTDSGGRLTVLLAGRPYHSDPLIQHKVSEMIASLGCNVINEDIVRDKEISTDGIDFVSQWSYTNRIIKAAKWCASQGDNVQFVQMTSFGCGPDAFLVDSVRDLLARYGKTLTLLKLDDINNVGSMKLRIRSLIGSIRLSSVQNAVEPKPFRTTPVFGVQDRKKKILIPFFTPFISPLIPAIMKHSGYDVESLPLSDGRSVEYGLKYANNEVCYPATLVIGDLLKALSEGGYDLNETVVAMTQTGGQCRASNYLPLIKKALTDAGFGNVPVISVSFGSGIANEQPGFRINWFKTLPGAVYGVLYSDTLAKLYYAAKAREMSEGEADRIKYVYLRKGAEALENGRWSVLLEYIRSAASEFNSVTEDRQTKKVGIVGEIFLKFNPFAHKDITGWLVGRGVEIVPPVLADFFVQFFVNRKVAKKALVEKGGLPDMVFDSIYRLYRKHVEKFNDVARGFRAWNDFHDIFDEAEAASRIIDINARFGEGWLLPGEIATYYGHGVRNVISLQPFGCIANHIIERGIEKKIKSLFPEINLLSLDFDSGVSEVNVTNRMLLFIDNLK